MTTGTAKAPRTSARATATFEPYFWEAYNEIVRPDRFDWYLVTRWLPDLGALGFALVKALRTLCYFNPATGKIRDECEIDVSELAAMVGTSRPTVYRELERNEALGKFVQRQEQIAWQGDRPVRHKPRFRVCMDTPVHPDDEERYEALRAQKECDRARQESDPAPGRYRILPKSQSEISGESPKSQIETRGARKSQIETPQSQIETPKSHSGITSKEVSLPSGGSIPSDLFTPSAGADAPETPPQSDPPGGERHGSAVSEEGNAGETLPEDPLRRAWDKALRSLATQVNKPTFEAHLRPLRPGAWDEAAGEVEILCPSAFTREWIAKRHGDQIAALLAEALGRESVTLRLTAPGK